MAAKRRPGYRSRVRLEARLAKNLERLPEEERQYALLALPAHLAHARRRGRLEALLWHPSFLRAKLEIAKPLLLIGDFDGLAERSPLRLVQQALRLSEHALAGGGGHLASQLLGRLSNVGAQSIKSLAAQAAATQPRPWIRPLTPSLARPASGLNRFLRGHDGEVRDVAMTRDGSLAISASDDGTIKLWNLENGQAIRTLTGHNHNVWRVVITADGTRAFSGADKAIREWDLRTGRTDRQLRGHEHAVGSLVLSSSEKLLVSGSSDGTVRIWNLATYSSRTLRCVERFGIIVRAICLSPDEQTLLVAVEKEIQVWDVPRASVRGRLAGHTQFVEAVAIDSTGTRAFSASMDGSVKLWDLESMVCLDTIQAHDSETEAVALLPNCRQVITASNDHSLRIWDVPSRKQVQELRGHAGPVHAVAVSTDGSLAASASHDGTVGIWDLRNTQRPGLAPAHRMGIRQLTISPDSRFALTGSDDATLKVWDLEKFSGVRTIDRHWGAIAVSHDSRLVLSAGTRDGEMTLRLWELPDGRVVHEWRYWTEEDTHAYNWTIHGIAFTRDGRQAVTASTEFFLRIWDIPSGALLGKLEGHEAPVKDVLFTRDGRTLISGSNDGTIRTWAFDKRGKGRVFFKGAEALERTALSHDGRRLVAVDGEGSIKAWEFPRRRSLWTVSTEHVSSTVGGKQSRLNNDLALDSEHGLVLTGAEDAALRLWDLQSGREVAAFFGDSAVLSCCTVPRRNLLLAGERSGALHFLRLER